MDAADTRSADEYRRRLDLAAGEWVYVQQYGDAKTEVVAEILARTSGAR